MIDLNFVYELLKIFKEIEYVNVMIDIDKVEDYELMLSRELIRVFDLMYYISLVKIIIDLMSIKYDYYNIKVILKGIFLKKDLFYFLINVGIIDVLKLRDLI